METEKTRAGSVVGQYILLLRLDPCITGEHFDNPFASQIQSLETLDYKSNSVFHSLA